MQPYLTRRMLRQSDALTPLGTIALAHHERLDGSGYPRALQARRSLAPRLLGAAADADQVMREPRPHRSPLGVKEAAQQFRAGVRSGQRDTEAVEAVLGRRRAPRPRRQEGLAGLTAREVEVLRLVAQGLSNKEIGARLVISPKTVPNHVEHIYAKIDASNRAAAGLFAMPHGLLPDQELAPARVTAA